MATVSVETCIITLLLHIGHFIYECFRDIDLACATWEWILYDHPTDAFTLRLLHNGYYHLGANEMMRDSIARVLPQWSKSRPLYGYVLGMHAFGLCETKDFEKSAAVAHKASCSLPFPLIARLFDSLIVDSFSRIDVMRLIVSTWYLHASFTVPSCLISSSIHNAYPYSLFSSNFLSKPGLASSTLVSSSTCS